MPTINNWGVVITPDTDTNIVGRTAAGTSGRMDLASAVDACAQYGHLYYDGSGTNYVLAANNTWYPFTGFSAGSTRGLVGSTATTPDYLVIPSSGMYMLHMTGSVLMSAAATLEIAACANDTPLGGGLTMRENFTTVGTLGGQLGCCAPVRLTAGDEISVYLMVTAGASVTATVYVLSLTAYRIGA